MEQLELEGVAESAYAEARMDPESPHVPRLARALLGPKAIQRGPRLIGASACLARLDGQTLIFVARNLRPLDALFAIAHELGHFLLQRHAYDGEAEEEAANALGAALLIPRPAFRAAYRSIGDDLPALAEAFCSTETSAALRLGEVTGRPLAVVAPRRVRVRGPEAWVWPDEITLRQWAQRPAPGLRKTKLRDDPRRVVLDAFAA